MLKTMIAERGALAGLALAMLLSSLGTSIANVGLPTLERVFNASFQEVQWVVLAYLLAITTMIVSAGRLGDKIGRRRLLLIGIGLFTVASLLCGWAPQLWLLIAARALQGLGAAVMMALTMALVGETVAQAKTGSAMGLLATMSALGTALGPSLGGGLIAGLGWRAIFLVNVPLGMLAFFLVQRALPPDGRGPQTLCGLGLFVLTMVRDPLLSGSLLMSALVSTVMMTTLVVGPFYLSAGLGLEPAGVGLVLSVGPLVAALTGLPAGRAADRFGAQRGTWVGVMALGVGCSMLAMMPVRLGLGGYLAAMVVMSAGYGLFQTANNTAVMATVPPDQRGVLSGLLNLTRNLGQITGASAMGSVFARASTSLDIASGMRLTFAVAAILMGVAVAIARAVEVHHDELG